MRIGSNLVNKQAVAGKIYQAEFNEISQTDMANNTNRKNENEKLENNSDHIYIEKNKDHQAIDLTEFIRDDSQIGNLDENNSKLIIERIDDFPRISSGITNRSLNKKKKPIDIFQE